MNTMIKLTVLCLALSTITCVATEEELNSFEYNNRFEDYIKKVFPKANVVRNSHSVSENEGTKFVGVSLEWGTKKIDETCSMAFKIPDSYKFERELSRCMTQAGRRRIIL